MEAKHLIKLQRMFGMSNFPRKRETGNRSGSSRKVSIQIGSIRPSARHLRVFRGAFVRHHDRLCDIRRRRGRGTGNRHHRRSGGGRFAAPRPFRLRFAGPRSSIPVDVIGGDEFLTHGGDSDMDALLAANIPGCNVAQEPISDAATLIRPATLRSLPPDATLVLLNGKRRHRAAVIALLGAGISGGSQARTSRSSPPSRWTAWRYCATARRHSTAPTRSPAS